MVFEWVSEKWAIYPNKDVSRADKEGIGVKGQSQENQDAAQTQDLKANPGKE